MQTGVGVGGWRACMVGLLAVLGTACGADATASPSGGATGRGAPVSTTTNPSSTASPASAAGAGCCLQLAINVNLTGESPIQGTYDDPYLISKSAAATCSAWATSGISATGGVPLGGMVSGTAIQGGAEFPAGGYAGPGSYAIRTGPVGALLSIGTNTYQPFAKSSGALLINADGSGLFTFTNLRNPATLGLESGTFTWGCA